MLSAFTRSGVSLLLFRKMKQFVRERRFQHHIQSASRIHSIINSQSKPSWLKGLTVIDMGLYRRFYRQSRRSFAGAGDGAICGASTFSTELSIAINLR